MKLQTTKMLFSFIIMMMFSFTFVNAQTCDGNKIRVYKCVGPLGLNCVSKCVNPDQIRAGWSIYPCACGRGLLANEKNDGGLFTLAISPGAVFGSSTIYFFLEKSQKVSLKIFDLSGSLVSTLADKNFERGKNELVWNAGDVNAGVYFLQILSTENFQKRKVIVIK